MRARPSRPVRPRTRRRSARLVAATVALLLLGSACEDGTGPGGTPSDFEVHVYVETDDSAGMGAEDVPVAATVSVASNFDDLVLTAETGEDGIATFADIPPGAYTVTHVPSDLPDGAEPDGSASQTVVAPLNGDTVLTRFVYEFAPGSLSGVVFRDDNGSGSFEQGQDSTFEGFQVRVFAGSDTLGGAVAADTSEADGSYDVGELARGDYLVLVRPLDGTAVVGDNPFPVTITAGSASVVDIRIEGDPTGPVVPIQQAREAEDGETVKVRGVVTAAQGTYRDDSFYLQDPTGGILVFGVDPELGLAVGDSVQVIGERETTPWLEAEIVATSVLELGSGTVPEPVEVSTADLNAGLAQGMLASLSATVDSIGTALGGYLVHVHDAADDAVIFVDESTGIPQSEFTAGVVHTLVGILAVDDRNDDDDVDDGEYQLMPRDAEDVGVVE